VRSYCSTCSHLEPEWWVPRENLTNSEEVVEKEDTRDDVHMEGCNDYTDSEDKQRIVLADDNLDLCEYISKLLQPFYTVITVHDGQAALDAVLQHPPDLV
jgi:PleD family two-component response regulator